MTRSAASLALLALIAACDPDEAGAPWIPADHPCPERALPPAEASLWRDALASGAPVPLALALPFPAGTPAPVSQGHDQPPTHLGAQRWAWDFAVPLGTTVTAAAPGTVALVRDDSTRAGDDPTFQDDANFVLVDHGGGLFTAYVHLAAGSARVDPGQRVRAGDPLADTGLSGQLTGPHLHFAVENVWSETLPARFVGLDGAGCELDPSQGETLIAADAAALPLVSGAETDALPRDAFVEEGVLSVDGLPARRLRRERRYTVTGVADAGATDVFVLLLPEAGGDAEAFARMSVGADGAFTGTLRLDGMAPGRYGLGALAVGAGEDVFVDMAIRVGVE